MRRISILLALMIGMALPAATTAAPFPDRIELPDNFAPEGIATGVGSTFYTGSLSGTGIWRGDYRTGEGNLLVETGGPFVGMKVDAFNRLWVAGGPGGSGYVFDAASGELLETFSFAEPPTFVNDVVVTSDAAYFTESMKAALYRVPIGPGGEIGEPDDPIQLEPSEIGFLEGAFNLNGIDATPSGDTLIVVNSTAGTLYTINAETEEVAAVDLAGEADNVTNGDGILLHGRTLFVVENFDNHVTVIDLSPDLANGTVVEELTSTDFDVPTTIARFGDSLYAVNARFRPPGTPPPEEFWITRLDR
jgi:hypothetical protein